MAMSVGQLLGREIALRAFAQYASQKNGGCAGCRVVAPSFFTRIPDAIQRERSAVMLGALLGHAIRATSYEELVEDTLSAVKRVVQDGKGIAIPRVESALLLEFLRRFFGSEVDEDTERRICAASIDEIAVWAGRALYAPTLAEALDD